MSPTARALLALEVIQNSPGITAESLGSSLGVTERAARRYVAILREADLPIDSVSGPHGGYRVGRGLRLPPLMFTAAEAMGLVMAVLEGHRDAADPTDLVGSALAKIVRVLPERVAGPVRAFRAVSAAVPASATAPCPPAASPDPELTARLIEACTAARRVRLAYRMRSPDRMMEVDPWAVVLRHSRWYLLGWSHTAKARRVLRVDRIVAVEFLRQSFMPPRDLDALRALEDHLSQGWRYPVDVLVDATVQETSRWLPRSLGRLEPCEGSRTRIRATTDEPDWYARQLAAIPAPFRVIGSPELQRAMAALGQRLAQAGSAQAPRVNSGSFRDGRLPATMTVSATASRVPAIEPRRKVASPGQRSRAAERERDARDDRPGRAKPELIRLAQLAKFARSGQTIRNDGIACGAPGAEDASSERGRAREREQADADAASEANG